MTSVGRRIAPANGRDDGEAGSILLPVPAPLFSSVCVCVCLFVGLCVCVYVCLCHGKFWASAAYLFILARPCGASGALTSSCAGVGSRTE